MEMAWKHRDTNREKSEQLECIPKTYVRKEDRKQKCLVYSIDRLCLSYTQSSKEPCHTIVRAPPAIVFSAPSVDHCTADVAPSTIINQGNENKSGKKTRNVVPE